MRTAPQTAELPPPGLDSRAWAKTDLTPREREIAKMLIDEAPTNAAIAARFGLSEETVKRHLSNIMDKTGHCTRMELALHLLNIRWEASHSTTIDGLRSQIKVLQRELAEERQRVSTMEQSLQLLGCGLAKAEAGREG